MSTDGETPLADFDGLRQRHIRTRAQLAVAEAENIRRAVIRYLIGMPSRKVATFEFRNGNGRWSRMLSNIWLRIHACPIVEWPATIVAESPIRAEYLACLRAADARDTKPLLALHARHQPGRSS